MLIHPDMLTIDILAPYIQEKGKGFKAAPTASGRTVKLLDTHNSFLKLNYPQLLGRIERHLAKKHALTSLEVSSFIGQTIDEKKLPDYFYFMRDVSAKVAELPYNGALYEWGVIEREPFPSPYNADIKFIIPGFSMFSTDIIHPEDESLICQLINKQNKSAADFLFDNVFAPVFSCFFTCLLTCGLQLEVHAQNTLFGIDEDFNIIGVIFKDAESVDKDLTLMEYLGINMSFKSDDYKCIREGMYNYQILHSYMFDFKLGEYLISPLIDKVSAHYDVNVKNLEGRIKEYNSQYIQELPRDFFPTDWYSYPNNLLDRTKRRPYVAHKNPKYRNC